MAIKTWNLRAEETACAYENGNRYFIVGVDFSKTLGQSEESIFGQSVEFSWSVDGDDCDAALIVDLDPSVRLEFSHHDVLEQNDIPPP